MAKHIYTMLFAILVAISVFPLRTEADIPQPKPIPTDVKGMIVYYGELYGAKVEEMNLIVNDESGFTCNPRGHNDGGRAFGPAQYHEPTFLRYEKMMGIDLNYRSCHDQIKLMAWQYANVPTSKCEWTLYKNLYCKK